MQGVLNRFKNFLIEDKKQGLTFGRLTELVISDFQDYLNQRSKGEGAASYFMRFKKMVKQAYRQKLLLVNPAAEVKTKMGKAKKKDVLSLDEIKTLIATPCESEFVKNGFLFSCMTGLSWTDLKSMTWDDIDLKTKRLTTARHKTDVDFSINLNATALKFLPNENGSELVFDLPTANGANKTVKAWVKRAGIKKKITWHNARHSYGTNLVFHGTDLLTTSKLMGHTTTKHTERYAKIVEELKQRATDKLNIDL
jgi:site-specific recombinase XerD